MTVTSARCLEALCAVAACLAAAQACAKATPWIGDAHASARLITAIETSGASKLLHAGIEIRLARGWHTYWRDPGEAGIAPEIDWSGSVNVARAEVAWPTPLRFVDSSIPSNGYENDVVLPVSIELARPGAPTRLAATLGYAACGEVCIPYRAELALVLPSGLAYPSPEADLIASARDHVPGDPSSVGLSVEAVTRASSASGEAISIALRSRSTPLRRPDLFIDGAADARATIALEEGGLAAKLQVFVPKEAGRSERRPSSVTLVDGTRAAVLALL